MKHIFISILNFNGKKNTIECLKSIDKIKINNFRLTVLVIDNASFENFDIDNDFKTNYFLKIIRNKTNLGFSGGQNTGIRHALDNGADYVLVLNNDTFVHADFLEALFKVIETDNTVGIAVPKIYFAKGFEYYKDRYRKEEQGRVFWYAGGQMDWKNIIGRHRGVDEVDSGQYDKIEQTELATGGCMLVRKSFFEKVGLFDEKYFLYYEDSDLSMRARKSAYEIMYVPSSIVWHKNAGSAGGSGSTLQDYYISRNRLLFGFKYAKLRLKLALIKESYKILRSGRSWQKRGVLDFYLRRFGRGSFDV